MKNAGDQLMLAVLCGCGLMTGCVSVTVVVVKQVNSSSAGADSCCQPRGLMKTAVCCGVPAAQFEEEEGHLIL